MARLLVVWLLLILGTVPRVAVAQTKADTLAVWEGLLTRHHDRSKRKVVLDRRIRQLADPQQLGGYHDAAWLDSLVNSGVIVGTCDSNCFPGFQSDTLFLALGTPDFTSAPGSVLLFQAFILVGGRSRCPECSEEERDEQMFLSGGRWTRGNRSRRVTMGYFDSRCRPPIRYSN
jgi:hypothetical protein